jgi:hypothetical protein
MSVCDLKKRAAYPGRYVFNGNHPEKITKDNQETFLNQMPLDFPDEHGFAKAS